jgi:hypothetical protein
LHVEQPRLTVGQAAQARRAHDRVEAASQRALERTRLLVDLLQHEVRERAFVCVLRALQDLLDPLLTIA